MVGHPSHKERNQTRPVVRPLWIGANAERVLRQSGSCWRARALSLTQVRGSPCRRLVSSSHESPCVCSPQACLGRQCSPRPRPDRRPPALHQASASSWSSRRRVLRAGVPSSPFTITNEASTQTLGSVQITALAGFVITSAPGATSVTPSSALFINLNLQPGATTSMRLTVNVTPSSSGAGAYQWGIKAKQSNDFNGTGNDFQLDPGECLGLTRSLIFPALLDHSVLGVGIVGDDVGTVTTSRLPRATSSGPGWRRAPRQLNCSAGPTSRCRIHSPSTSLAPPVTPAGRSARRHAPDRQIAGAVFGSSWRFVLADLLRLPVAVHGAAWHLWNCDDRRCHRLTPACCPTARKPRWRRVCRRVTRTTLATSSSRSSRPGIPSPGGDSR